MIENLPSYISAAFILTTFLTIGFLLYSIRQRAFETVGAKIVLGLLPFWLFFTATLALGGFYADPTSIPPRLFLYGALPALALILIIFVFFRASFVNNLPLRVLTLLSVVRIPVEIVIFLLSENGQMPQLMTFAGRNFDILSGISAPFVFWLAFRKGKINRPLLIGWNLVSLLLLLNVVIIAVFSIPSPLQQFAFDQPNRAVMYFPYVWLPAIIVPIVLFSHLSAFSQLLAGSPSETRGSR